MVITCGAASTPQGLFRDKCAPQADAALTECKSEPHEVDHAHKHGEGVGEKDRRRELESHLAQHRGEGQVSHVGTTQGYGANPTPHPRLLRLTMGYMIARKARHAKASQGSSVTSIAAVCASGR